MRSIDTSRALVLVRDPLLRSIVLRICHVSGLSARTEATIAEAAASACEVPPDVIVTELLPGPQTGLDLVANLRKLQNRRIPAVILTSHRSPYLVQDSPPSLRDCSYLVQADVESPNVIREAIARAAQGDAGIHHNNTAGLPVLTRNQASVLRLVANGFSNEQIAKLRNKSNRAVELTVTRLYAALGLNRRSELNPRVAASLMYHQSKVAVR